MRGSRSAVATVGLLLLLVGCARPGAGSEGVAVGGRLVPDGYDGRFRTSATVLESPDHGPQLCGVVATSLPPQCGGPDIIGWDWAAVRSESANGTTWGSYLLVGTFDGTAFTLTEPAVVDDGTHPRPGSNPDFTAPCPEPAGGWAPVDPARTTEETLRAAMALAQGSDGYAGLWVDQQGATDNDPRGLVLVVRTTGDVPALDGRLREVWGGAQCVTGARFTEAQLLAAQNSLAAEPGFVSSGVDVVGNRVELTVLVATQARQRQLDERLGVGLVLLSGLLEPVD